MPNTLKKKYLAVKNRCHDAINMVIKFLIIP
jgi:hypothetical protein